MRESRRLPSGQDMSRGQVEEIQRSRLLAAAAATIDELGYERTSVQRITGRARISRRTFYELFGSRDACLVALIDEVAGRIERELAVAGLERLAWRERVRGGLWAILSFLDEEPVLARICVVQALHGGPRVLERREQILARLAAVLDEGRFEGPRGVECTLVTAEGLVGGAFGVVYRAVAQRRPGAVDGAAGGVDGDDRAAVFGAAGGAPRTAALGSRSASCSAQSWRRGRAGRAGPAGGGPDAPDLPHGAGARITSPSARWPATAWSRDHAGVADPGQISKLLRRLERLGLTANTGGGHQSGEPNAWKLTPLGGQVAQRLSLVTLDRKAAA